jgi:hypothetical protein
VLAYVFWHWPRSGVSSADYESAQQRFHAALGAAPPPGFRQSWSVAISGAPWTGAEQAYEDWYLLDGSEALDPLNAAAVSASRQSPHDAAAALAANGTAGLYTVKLGTAVAPPRVATWLAKPAGMSYPDLYSTLAPLVGAGGGVMWLRQMVLGPTPECCIQSDRPLPLPPPFQPQEIGCRTVWPR